METRSASLHVFLDSTDDPVVTVDEDGRVTVDFPGDPGEVVFEGSREVVERVFNLVARQLRARGVEELVDRELPPSHLRLADRRRAKSCEGRGLQMLTGSHPIRCPVCRQEVMVDWADGVPRVPDHPRPAEAAG